jgi:hypothetical protein
MKVQCFTLIRKLSELTVVKQLAKEVDLLSIIVERLSMSLMVMQRNRHLETTKKIGVQKVSGTASCVDSFSNSSPPTVLIRQQGSHHLPQSLH